MFLLAIQRAALRLRIAYLQHRADSMALDVACLQADLDQLPITIEAFKRARLQVMADESRLQVELSQLEPVARPS